MTLTLTFFLQMFEKGSDLKKKSNVTERCKARKAQFQLKKPVQKARKFHDLNMDFVASNNFMHRYLCKKIQSKVKALECSQRFLHYNSMEAIICHGNQNSDQIWPKT